MVSQRTRLDDAGGADADEVPRSSRKALIGYGLGLAIVVGIAFLSRNYYRYFFSGPVRLSDDQLLALVRDPESTGLIVYADLGRRPLVETGWLEVTTSDDKPIADAHYYLVPVGDEFLLALAESREDAQQLTGPISPLRPLDRQVLDGILKERPEYQDRVPPVLLNDTAAFEVIGYIGLVILLPLGALCVIKLALAFSQVLDPYGRSTETQ